MRTDETLQVRIGLLGPVRAWLGDAQVPVGPPRQQALLAVLATNPNQVVSRSELVDAIWGTTPPASVVGSVHTYVAGLRRALEPTSKPFRVLVSAGSGYSLQLDPDRIDAARFSRCRQQARRLVAAGDIEGALGCVDEALGLWSGTPLGTVGGPFADVERQRLHELRLDLVEERVELLLRLRRLEGVAGELSTVLADNPLRESTLALLIRVLHQQGQVDEAIATYRNAAKLLDTRLGVEPSPALRQLHDALLAGRPATAQPEIPRIVPSQLPHDTRRFTGRHVELRQLDALLTPVNAGSAAVGGTVVISTIEGTAGVGKTSLAVHWSHQVREKFPDGQLYLNLRGFDVADEPVSPHDALLALLSAFRVPSEKIPSDTAARTALLRSVMSGRRLLMVLDNAVSTEQVTPLLPANQSCVVLVTSRNRLDGLGTTGDSRQLTVGLFDDKDAAMLLASYIDPQRVEQERAAFEELLRLCAGLPLALSIVGARAWCSPNLPLAQFVDELRDAHFRLDALETGDDSSSNVRAVFSWSYHALSPAAARMFRLLGLHDGADISRHATSALADVSEREAQELLDELTRAHLLESQRDGRYQFHDLLRVYALECATEDESPDTRTQAVLRAVHWYMHAANAADPKILADKPNHEIPPPPAHWSFPELPDTADARAWFKTEEANLVAATRRAVELGDHGAAWRLPQSMSSFWYVFNKRWDLWWEMLEISAEHARIDGDQSGEAAAYTSMGLICDDRRHHDRAVECYQKALSLFPPDHERWGIGIVHNALGYAYVSLGRFDDAMDSLRTAADLFEQVDNGFGRAWAMQGVATVYNAMGKHELAREYGEQTLVEWRKVSYPHGIGSGLNLLGEIHVALENFDTAVAYYDEAVEVRQSINDQFGIAIALQNRAVAQLGCERTEQARESLRTALPILESLGAEETAKVSAQLAELDEA